MLLQEVQDLLDLILVDKLVEEGHEVHVIDNFSSGKKENCNNKAKYL